MRQRLTSADLTAAVLVLVAALIWTVWGAREFRRRRTVPAPAVAFPRSVPFHTDPILPVASPNRTLPSPLPDEVAQSVQAALAQAPRDPGPLRRLSSMSADEAADRLLDFAEARYSIDVRLEALRLVSDCGYTMDRIRRVSAMFDSDPDEQIRTAILLSVEKRPNRGSEVLARHALHDPSDGVRSVAVASLDVDCEADRALLISVTAADPSELVRGSAAIQLSDRIGDAGVLDALLVMATNDASDQNRGHAVDALVRPAARGEARVEETLRWLAGRDRSPEVRGKAETALKGAKR